MEIGTDGRTVELIQAACFAGAYSSLARAYPDSPGLDTLRQKWSGRVKALAGQVAERAANPLTR